MTPTRDTVSHSDTGHGNGSESGLRYVRSRHLQIEQQAGDEMVLVHSLLGNRLEVNEATYRFLELFEKPRSLEDLASPAAVEKVRPSFERLQRASFLIPEDHQETLSDKILRRVSPGLFRSPAYTSRTETPPEVVFLGVPFDYGNHKDPGARYGPEALRRLSQTLHYVLEHDNGRPKGWYDNRLDRPILQGVTLGDAGDLFIAPNESPGQVFRKLRGAVERILDVGGLPVALGGDHSITFATVSAYRRPLSIFQIDAHTDLAPYFPSVENHHGNVMSRALTLDHVEGIYQVGGRGTTAAPLDRGRDGVELCLSPRALRDVGIDGVLERMPADRDYYVSLDIDALDPAQAPGTSTPVPGGLGFEEVLDLLNAVAGRRRCIGFDLVEINPRRDPQDLTAAVGLELLLAFLGSHFLQPGRQGDPRQDPRQDPQDSNRQDPREGEDP